MDSLPIFVALRGREVLVVGDGEAADAKARLIAAAGGLVVREPAPGVRLAFVALDDAGEAAAAAARLKAAGLLVNVVDRPALCDFTVPAIVDRSPVLVAVGTGGASASLAKAVRQRLEAMLPARLGDLATAIRAARAQIAARFPDPALRRAALDRAMATGGSLDPFVDTADDAIDALLADAAASPSRTVEIVLRSADPDELTLREARWLAQADRLLDDGAPEAVLARARRDAVRGGLVERAVAVPGLTVCVVG